MLTWSCRRIEDVEIPRIALLTAAFFVASLIHVRAGPTSVHLLLTGLLGLILGRRAVPAIAVGLLLQCLLLNHGGISALGLNICIIAVPALLTRPLYQAVLWASGRPSFRFRDGLLALMCIFTPILAIAFATLSFALLLAKRRMPERGLFQLGFLIGSLGVMTTVLLNSAVLVLAGNEDWRIIAAVVVLGHIPVAVIEGLIAGSIVTFLNRVKPEMLPQCD